MLQSGARKSYALDVGTNQLAWKIRQDERVIVMEQFNFRYAKVEDFTEGQPSFSSIDVSFISLGLILPPLYDILEDEGEVVALIKPQFEAGRDQIGKNGIIKDPSIHKETIKKVLAIATDLGYSIIGLTHSPIKGGHGNMEFLVHLKKDDQEATVSDDQINNLVDEAHKEL